MRKIALAALALACAFTAGCTLSNDLANAKAIAAGVKSGIKYATPILQGARDTACSALSDYGGQAATYAASLPSPGPKTIAVQASIASLLNAGNALCAVTSAQITPADVPKAISIVTSLETAFDNLQTAAGK